MEIRFRTGTRLIHPFFPERFSKSHNGTLRMRISARIGTPLGRKIPITIERRIDCRKAITTKTGADQRAETNLIISNPSTPCQKIQSRKLPCCPAHMLAKRYLDNMVEEEWAHIYSYSKRWV